MKIIVALDNLKIKESLDNIYNKDVYKHDITYMEGVIEYLGNNIKVDEKYILITKDTIEGNLTKHMYLKQLRLANSKVRIILFVKKLDNNYKEFLFANEIFDIIETESISIEELKNLIDSESPIIYKYIDSNENQKLNCEVHNKRCNEIISVFGTSGSGKSYISSQITNKITHASSGKVCLLDMDIQNPSIDILNNIDSKNYNISRVIDSIDTTESINNISKYMYYNNNKAAYLTNNVSIYEYQNKLSTFYYEKIYNHINKEFDYTIIDLPSSPFIDVVEYTLKISSKILFVVNPNYVSIRQAVKYLDLMTRIWEVSKEKIYIVINKVQKNSLEKLQIENILNEYKVILNVKYNGLVEGYINGFFTNMDENMDLDMLYSKLGLKVNNNAKNIKQSILTTILTKNKGELINDNRSS